MNTGTSFAASRRPTQPRTTKNANGMRKAKPMRRPHSRCAYSSQKMDLNPLSVMSGLRSLYSGKRR